MMTPRGKRTVVITGASAGVGRAIAHRFAAAGCRLGLIARDAAALRDVVEEVERMGADALAAPADVADADAVFEAATAVRARFGPIDVWVNDAMATIFAPVWQVSPAEYRRVTEVTYLGAVHGTMAALRDMRGRDQGSIIQIGSALAYRGIPLQAAYCGAKHAIRGFTDSLRCELMHADSGVTVTMMELPAVNTPQFDWARTRMPRQPRPVAPVVQPEVVADAVFRASLVPRREYWIGWSTIKVILGNMALPGFADRYLAAKIVEAQETRLPVTPNRRDNLMAPVHDLHRTRGRFGGEAQASAWVITGEMARLVPLVAGAAAFFVLGLAAGRGRSWRSSGQPRRLGATDMKRRLALLLR
jgi:short-subunit dehydrogenase